MCSSPSRPYKRDNVNGTRGWDEFFREAYGQHVSSVEAGLPALAELTLPLSATDLAHAP